MGKPITHGTYSGYVRHKCRCEECKEARREYLRQGPRSGSAIPHGTRSGYIYHKCRCEQCKAANKEYIQNRRKADPETYSGYSKKYRQDNPEKIAELSRRRREADPGYQRRYYEANRESQYEATRRWRAENPEKIRELLTLSNQRRRARMRNAFVEDVRRHEIFERDNWQCQIPGCLFPGVPVRLDVDRFDPLFANLDHIIPLSKGGKHERSNLACSHSRCNTVKRDRIEGIA